MGFFLQGLTLGLAYVAPIGMQNLFVINSALTEPRKRALRTALIVLLFDISLSLSCFFGIGRLMQRYDWLRLGVLAVGGVAVIRIGARLLFAKRTDTKRHDETRNLAHNVPMEPRSELLHTIMTAGAVTWLNPQAIIDGTLMLGAFSATLDVGQPTPFITGVETASALWFFGMTLLVSLFSRRFSPKLAIILNRVCGGMVIFYGSKLLVDFFFAVL